MNAILKDPGAWIALGVTVISLVAAIVMHRIFVKILKQSPPPEADKTPEKDAKNT